MDSLPSLVETMRLASIQVQPNSKATSVDESLGSTCLVAAKVLYFGVGGGVSDFMGFVERNGYGKARVVWERKTGVGRVIMSVEF